MPSAVNGSANTLRILVSTDNHVGYSERDPYRGDDSWKTFHEIMCLARERDVDMVLLGGDLFHDNIPSRKSLYNVMRSLRMNCYGDKPCEVQILSDSSEHFDPSIGHANVEDSNINVAIPVFSIHGNHDDPSGEGHFAALDILEMSGLINYFGRVPESDNIDVKPLLLQKGSTKLAVYGISNVRDERMYRTFRDGHVTFHTPQAHKDEWYNIGVVHQNHHAYTATSYLPEEYLPEMLDLVIWGHEHECLIEPKINTTMGFKVMQPGSSVCTSLAPGEAVQKHVAIVSITGRTMQSEAIPLRTVRPFLYKEIILSQEKEPCKMAEKSNGYQAKLTQWLVERVNEMIEEAGQQWLQSLQTNPYPDDMQPDKPPLPLIRLRVETSGPNGGNKFETENPQRFSNRFTDKVANINDIVQFHQKRRILANGNAKATEELKKMMAKPVTEGVRMAKLVQDFLGAQELSMLPANCFGDAVNMYVTKDDKHAMDVFVEQSLAKGVESLKAQNAEDDDDEEDDEEDLVAKMDEFKRHLEELFDKGQLKNKRNAKRKYKPKPDGWDSDADGNWEDQPGAVLPLSDGDEEPDVSDASTPEPTATRGRGRGRARGGRTAAASTRGRGGAKKTPAKTTRGKKKAATPESEDDDIIMIDDDDDDVIAQDDDEDDSQAMFFPPSRNGGKQAAPAATSSRAATSTRSGKAATTVTARAPTTRKAPARSTKQSQLNFSASQASVLGNARSAVSDIEDDDDDDDDDEAFAPPTTSKRKR